MSGDFWDPSDRSFIRNKNQVYGRKWYVCHEKYISNVVRIKCDFFPKALIILKTELSRLGGNRFSLDDKFQGRMEAVQGPACFLYFRVKCCKVTILSS